MDLIRKSIDVVSWAFDPENCHKNTRGWALTDVRVGILIVSSYLVVVLSLREWIRRRGQGFELKPVVLAHNLSQLLLSLYMFVETARQVIIQRYSLIGNPIDESSAGYGMAHVLWVFFLSKIPEFFDSILMALRKRHRQLSFLHLYHHSSIFFVCWAGVFFFPGGDTYFTCLWNTAVHVLMYGYYFASSFCSKPKPGTKLTWKDPAFYRPYLTRLQITQFFALLWEGVYTVLMPTPYPKSGGLMLALYMCTMLVLFIDFYVKAYSNRKEKVNEDMTKPKEA